jgi:hypothetical protein
MTLKTNKRTWYVCARIATGTTTANPARGPPGLRTSAKNISTLFNKPIVTNKKKGCTTMAMEQTTYDNTVIYRGQVVCVDSVCMLANKGEFTEQELMDPDGWLASANDGENVWIEATCEACGAKFRPIDGYYEPDEYSYCRDCCHW